MPATTSRPTRRSASAERELVDELPPRVPWAELGPAFLGAWGRPNGKIEPEHVEIIGPTGSGKSLFERVILEDRVNRRRSHVVLIATKPADETIRAMRWPVITKWPPGYGQNQVIFWAKGGLSAEARARQRAAIVDLLDKLWVARSNRVVVFDEIAYVQQELRLGTHLTTYYREARAMDITIVANTQRPSGVTRYMHSESAWTIFFAPKDADDAKRAAEIAGDRARFQPALRSLRRDKYEFLLLHNRTGEAYISAIDKKRANTSLEPPK